MWIYLYEGASKTLIEERNDGKCYVLPPPIQCPRCTTVNAIAIAHNEYYEGPLTTSKMNYFELFYKCLACNFRLEHATRDELAIFNSYPSDKQMWPESMEHRKLKGKMVR